ncbi:hypothetical protein ACOJVU_01735 [Mycobacterium sp. THU-M104]|uniref:hypothetical protein n=1 Tax=Mycobacterium sp. THU-M104 TaxID=3410515 RepID=UPI003B9A44D4
MAEALALLHRFLPPLMSGDAAPAVARYEDFVAQPAATPDAALGRWGLTFSGTAAGIAHLPPGAGR